MGTRHPLGISFSSLAWLCLLAVSLAQGSVAPGCVCQAWLCECVHACVYKAKAATILSTEGITDAAAYSLSLSSPLILLPPSGARNTPETAITYTSWEWCQSGCWLRVAGVCFSVAFHTLCTTLQNPGGLVPLWAPLYHLSKSSPHEGKTQLAKRSWRLGSTKSFVHSPVKALNFRARWLHIYSAKCSKWLLPRIRN